MQKPKYIKHLILITLILVGLFNIQNISYGDGVKPYDLHLTIDGKKVNFTDELGHPMLIKETQRTIVPVRIISENMGYKVGWDQKTKTATISDNKTKIEVKIGENTALVNGKRVHMDKDNDGTIHNTQAMLIPAKGKGNDRTYVPLRFVAEAMGAEVEYKRVNGKNYIEIWTGKVEEPKDDVGFIEPEITVTQLTNSKHVSNYFVMTLENDYDYKDTGITISTELTNWPDFVEYREWSVLGPDLRVYDDNKYYSNWDYKQISNNMGRFYELGRKTIAKKVNSDEPVSIPKDGYILKYKVTVTVGKETKVYNIDVPFYNKKFSLDE